MNHSGTQEMLDIVKKYLPTDGFEIQTESTGWRGRKYKSDFVNISEAESLGFEVFDNEIIVFFFGDHVHFRDDVIEDCAEETYLTRAKDFWEKLFTLPILRCTAKKGNAIVREESFFLISETEKESCAGVCLTPSLKNIFHKTVHTRKVIRFDRGTGRFLTV